jgi:glyoxylase-like metal-dependent hydrolase (beta-lactamase superfamily II)
MSNHMEKVTDGVHRHADGLVNWYLVEDGDELLLVDAGWPSSWSRIVAAVEGLGRKPGDLRSVLLTHGHADHMGSAEKVRSEWGTPVHARDTEVDRVRGKAKGSSSFALVPGLLPHLWRPSAFGFVLHAARHGFMTPTWVKQVTPFAAGEVASGPLDLPGRPTPVATPGHTAGHTSFVLPDRGVLLSGDALVTLDVLSRDRGPRLMPDAVTDDPAAARSSLDALAGLEAELLLPGHGQPWRGTPAEAVRLALAETAPA